MIFNQTNVVTEAKTRVTRGTTGGRVDRGRNEFSVDELRVQKPVIRATIALKAGTEQGDDVWVTYMLESVRKGRVTFVATDTFDAGVDAIIAIDFLGLNQDTSAT